VVIGDRYQEVEMAHRLGLRGALVLTGYGRGEYEYQRARWPRSPDWVAENLLDAVEQILPAIR
jgi:D-glycero-D-manno-heptose 1,7-bisphosphate phosphatase